MLAAHGYARATLTEVARRAGLSHGLVNFHFATKEGLLRETLLRLAEEYRENWTSALAAAPERPEAQLLAMLMAAWCSFWGEAQSRPFYQENCSSNDEEYIRVLEGVCGRLIAEGGYGGEARVAARVLRVTVEGVWLDLMTMREPYGRDEALRTVMACAAAFFPRHFSEAGLRAA